MGLGWQTKFSVLKGETSSCAVGSVVEEYIAV